MPKTFRLRLPVCGFVSLVILAVRDARWNFLYLSIAGQTLKVSSGRKGYLPLENVIKLAYIHDL